ncbi:hypothetical protein Vadar_031644 [Vaccinium darrowii]|uniref:Uncharacterized protein n=1 Tax=Vaccinium darrowii TaxID=229202 RepID=A0ACB7ZML9_9ERIC|nr:hypothetical protein Vadar_031644 [Vaccinium darrowii]
MEKQSMDIEINRSFSPISCEVLDSARDESRSRRKLEFEDDDAFLNMDVPMEDDGEQDESHNSDDLTGDINFVHSKISNEAIPKVDMKFMTEEAAYQFYNAYAYKVGFSVRRSKEHKDKSGRIVTRIFCCSCEGKRGKDKRDVIVKSHRPETRFGCLARMKIKYCRETKQYYVAEFGPVHNHMVCTPSKTHLHRSHRKFSDAQAAQADMANDSGIAPRAIVEFMAREVDDPKAMMGIRYKELCRLCTQLATRAAETEEAHKIALNALKKIAEEVDASLMGEPLHETSNAIIIASQEITETTYGEGSEKRAKGLKVKKRTTRSSKRPRNALERAIKSKRAPVKNPVEHEIQDSSPFTQAPLSQPIDDDLWFYSFEYGGQPKE